MTNIGRLHGGLKCESLRVGANHGKHPRFKKMCQTNDPGVIFLKGVATKSNPISLPQQQLGAIEKVTKIETDVKSVIGKSNTCV